MDVLLLRFCTSHITNFEISDVNSLSDHRVMKLAYQDRVGTLLSRGASRRWWQRILVCHKFLYDMQTADLFRYSYTDPDEGIELISLVRWHESVDGAGLDSDSIDLWWPVPKCEDLWRI